mgnify:FL=1
MLTAQEARKQSEKNSDAKIQSELKKISELIDDAVEKGNRYIMVEQMIESQDDVERNKSIMRALMRKGYTVRYNEWHQFLTIRIDW